MSPLCYTCRNYNELLGPWPPSTSMEDTVLEPSHFEPCDEPFRQRCHRHLREELAGMGAILIPSPGHPPSQTLLGIGAACGVWAIRELKPGYSG